MTQRQWGVVCVAFALLPAAACGGSTPTSPSPICSPITGPMTLSLFAGDLFRFKFTVPPRINSDVLVTILGEDASLRQAGTRLSVFDGTTLLGAVDNYEDGVAVWKSPDSLFGSPGAPYSLSGPAVVIDFRSIADGTIEGRVEFSITRGEAWVHRLDLATAALMQKDTANFIIGTVSGRELCR